MEKRAKMAIERALLRDRFIRSRARVVLITAPAGFGKSTSAQLLAHGNALICDCYGVATTLEFVSALLAALALESPGRATALAQHMSLATADLFAASTIVSDALARAEAPSTLVIENAEHLLRNPEAVALLGRALASSSPLRRIIVCSRVPLPVVADVAPPDVLSLGQADLRLSTDEVVALLPALAEDQVNLKRVLDVTAGWPLAVGLIRRLDSEVGIEAAIDIVRNARSDGLQEFVNRQIVAPLSDADRAMLVEAVALESLPPQATFEHARIEAFISRTNDSVVVHPVVRAAVERAFADDCRRLRRETAQAMLDTDPLQAARCYAWAGDEHGAARALEKLMEGIMSGAAADPKFFIALANLRDETLLAHPLLWPLIATQRSLVIHPRTWVAHAEKLWLSLDAQSHQHLIIAVFAIYAGSLVLLGRISEARRAFATYKELRSQPDIRDLITIASWGPYLEALEGNVAQVRALLTSSEPYVRLFPLVSAPFDFEVVARAARWAGDEASERNALERASVTARNAGLVDLAALVECDRVFSALIYGHVDEFQARLADLEALQAARAMPATRSFLAYARGEQGQVEADDRMPWLTASACIIACHQSGALDEARGFARSAITFADLSGQPFVRAAARTALAAVDRMAEAYLQAETEALCRATGGSPHLETLKQLIGERHRAALAPRLSIVDATITTDDGRTVALFNRETQLLALLALVPTASRDAIASALYPKSSLSSGRTALRVLVKRTRARFGEAIIVSTQRGYMLGTGIVVDVLNLERTLEAVPRDTPLTEQARRAIESVQAALAARPPVPLDDDSELLAGINRRLASLYRSALLALGRNALREGQPARALTYAEDLARTDRYDELAYEIMIEAHLARGDRSLADYALRTYSETLRVDLGAEPSKRLFMMASQATT